MTHDPTKLADELPVGAIENGREFFRRLEQHYHFTEEGGHALMNCYEFNEARRCFEHLAEFASLRRPTPPPDVAKLREAITEYVAEQDDDHWCQRLKYGQCALRKCNVEGGWEPGSPCDYSRATCSRFRLDAALTSQDAPSAPPSDDVERRSVVASAILKAVQDGCDMTPREALVAAEAAIAALQETKP